MMFGGWGNTDHDDSIKISTRPLDAGINFIDTRRRVLPGRIRRESSASPLVDRALQRRTRDEGPRADGQRPALEGNSRRWIMAEVEHSLKRLKTDYNRPLPNPPTDESTEHQEDARAFEGPRPPGQDPLLRISDLPGRTDRRASAGTERLRALRPSSLPYRSSSRHERDVLPTAQSFGMGVIPWKPTGRWLARGQVW